VLRERNLEAAKAIFQSLLENSFLVEVGISVTDNIIPYNLLNNGFVK
jgi:hypothetical protein